MWWVHACLDGQSARARAAGDVVVAVNAPLIVSWTWLSSIKLQALGIWNVKFCCRRMCAEKGHHKCCAPYGKRGDHVSFVADRRSSMNAARANLIKTEGHDEEDDNNNRVSEFAGLGYGT